MFVWNLRKCLEVFGECYVSSDSDEVLQMARDNGGRAIKRGQDLCGGTPNIPVYQHAMRFMNCDILVAVQANSPDLDIELIKTAKQIMLVGCNELMTCASTFVPYGSIWAMTRERLENYGDPFNPTPKVLLVDTSKDIHTKEDL